MDRYWPLSQLKSWVAKGTTSIRLVLRSFFYFFPRISAHTSQITLLGKKRLPTFSCWSMEAPRSMSSRQISRWPFCAVINRGVEPVYNHRKTSIGIYRKDSSFFKEKYFHLNERVYGSHPQYLLGSNCLNFFCFPFLCQKRSGGKVDLAKSGLLTLSGIHVVGIFLSSI